MDNIYNANNDNNSESSFSSNNTLLQPSLFWVVLTSIVGVALPWFAMFVLNSATNHELGTLNARVIFMVACLTLVVGVVRSIMLFTDKKYKLFYLNIGLTTIALVSFLYNFFLFVFH
jgi:hypothetical protein